MKRWLSLLVLLAGCAGDPDIDAWADGVVEASERAAEGSAEPVPEAQWRAAPACGEELPAPGSVAPVDGERGLSAWVAPDRRVLCVDATRRFSLEARASTGTPDLQTGRMQELGARAPMDMGAPRRDRRAVSLPPSPTTQAWQPDPQPMTQEGQPDPQPMTQSGQPDPQPMVQAERR